MLGLALLLAGAAVYLARGWLESQVPQAAEEQPQIALTKVVVATTTLYFGNTIRSEHVRLVDWPADALPPGSFQSVDELLGEAEERVVLRGMEVNEPVLKSKVSGFGGRASLSSVIAPEMRATTIRVNDVNGVAGFVLPGDRVDILLTRDPTAGGRRGGGQNLITDVLLQNIKVLGIDQQASEEVDKPAVVKAVTLEITQFQAQKLVLAQQVGFLSLALRNMINVEAETVRTVTLNDLRVGEANLSPNPDGTLPDETAKKKQVVVKKTSRKGSGLSVRIVRALQSTKVKVEAERSISSKPALSKPLNLVPTKSSPAVKSDGSGAGKLEGAANEAEPAADSGTATGAPTPLFRSAPTSQVGSQNTLAATDSQ
jgi:pilus assembly protein CpaB